MKKFSFMIPVHGVITTDIVADTPEEALNILTEKKASLEYHPMGHIELELESALITIRDEKCSIS